MLGRLLDLKYIFNLNLELLNIERTNKYLNAKIKYSLDYSIESIPRSFPRYKVLIRGFLEMAQKVIEGDVT